NGHEWVYLGLSVKWATCNVGATSPEDCGDYFAWGETKTKSSYDEETCPAFEKSVSQLKSAGIVSPSGILRKKYDAASANWGEAWRMPTKKEIDELVGECEWEWTSLGGRNGYKVTGQNGNSIFLPAAGDRVDSSTGDVGERGFYWSSSADNDRMYSFSLYFYNVDHLASCNHRSVGFAVRPVTK
ncbi:MAG: hypothetical protein NC336_09040, partial [Clostridium sp.]|nr:hypothetical protein [Clostridium sp.]